MVHGVSVEHSVSKLREANLQVSLIALQIELKQLGVDSFSALFINPVSVLLSEDLRVGLGICIYLIEQNIDFFELFVFKEPWSLGLNTDVCLDPRPEVEIVGALPESHLLVKQVYGGTCNQAFLKRLLHIVDGDSNETKSGKVFVLDREHDPLSDFVRILNARVELRLKHLAVE